MVAPMPTQSTSTFLGNTECFEPIAYNVFVHRTGKGEFVRLNTDLYIDLKERGLWTQEMRTALLASEGSVQNISSVPEELKEMYKTAFELSTMDLLDMAADRGPYIDQSASFNLRIPEVTHKKLTSAHFYGWRKGLKTGMYYLRSEARARPIKFTVDMELRLNARQAKHNNEEAQEEETGTIAAACSQSGGCVSCGS